MKKYKLIKSYPGSPKLGTEVNYSENNKIYNYNGGDFYSELPKHQVENLPEYWEEIVEKEYEILSFFNHEIESIMRLSDGKVFTVGDYIYSDFTLDGKQYIHSFTERDGCFCAKLLKENDKNFVSFRAVRFIKKVKKPLFTTEDGVDIFEDDYYYGLENHYKDIWLKIVKYVGCTKPNGIKQFSTKEAAEEYILMNKPCLSLKDVFKVYPEYKRKEPTNKRTNHANELIKLVKSKL